MCVNFNEINIFTQFVLLKFGGVGISLSESALSIKVCKFF